MFSPTFTHLLLAIKSSFSAKWTTFHHRWSKGVAWVHRIFFGRTYPTWKKENEAFVNGSLQNGTIFVPSRCKIISLRVRCDATWLINKIRNLYLIKIEFVFSFHSELASRTAEIRVLYIPIYVYRYTLFIKIWIPSWKPLIKNEYKWCV